MEGSTIFLEFSAASSGLQLAVPRVQQLSLHQVFTVDLCNILWADKIVKLPVDPNYGNNIRQDDESILQCLLCENNLLKNYMMGNGYRGLLLPL